MTIIVDSRERVAELKDIADEVRLLRYPNPENPAAPFSYDIEVKTEYGERIRFERKAADDFVQSFLNGKLDRQASIVDALIVEWDDFQIAMGQPSDSGKAKAYLSKYRQARRHMERMALSMPIIMTSSVQGTIDMLQYFSKLDKPCEKFENKVQAKGATVMEKLVRSMSPSIDNFTYERDIKPLIDPGMLLCALNIDRWPITPRVAKRIKDGILSEMEE